MNQGDQTQVPAPVYDEAVGTGQPGMGRPPQQPSASSFGAPPMGEPSVPSAHPDNQTAATYTAGGSPSGPGPNQTGPGTVGGGGGGLRRQSSGAYDASTATKTDKGLFSGNNQTQQPGISGTTPVGTKPGSPYVQTQDVPSTGTSPMNQIVGNFNKYMAKAEVLAGNIWGHMNTGTSPFDAARGRVSQGIKLVQEGGFEGLYKSTFGPMADGEQLRKTYACYLSTSTGPVAGTLYISNLKFSFCSDRPLAYAPTPGQTAWSYYKMVVPLEKVEEVVPSFNETKPAEKYIQVLTNDGHDFWFMGFVNYDKGVNNMRLAIQNIGVVDPNGGLKAPWAGVTLPGSKKTGGAAGQYQQQQQQQQGGVGEYQQQGVGGGHQEQQGVGGGYQQQEGVGGGYQQHEGVGGGVGQQGYVPAAGGPSPNYPPNQAPSTNI